MHDRIGSKNEGREVGCHWSINNKKSGGSGGRGAGKRAAVVGASGGTCCRRARPGSQGRRGDAGEGPVAIVGINEPRGVMGVTETRAGGDETPPTSLTGPGRSHLIRGRGVAGFPESGGARHRQRDPSRPSPARGERADRPGVGSGRHPCACLPGRAWARDGVPGGQHAARGAIGGGAG